MKWKKNKFENLLSSRMWRNEIVFKEIESQKILLKWHWSDIGEFAEQSKNFLSKKTLEEFF
jgi:hypothetical protein